MNFSFFSALLVHLLATTTAARPWAAASSLWVTETPNDLRPYAIKKNFGTGLLLANQVMRIPVSGNSSAGEFTVLQIASPEVATWGVVPHIHKRFYENFYVSRGRIQLWTQKNVTGAVHNTRVLTQGDFGGVPHHTIHTFQTLDPDTMFTCVIQPGYFENLFLYRGGPGYSSSIGSAWLPVANPLPNSQTPPVDVLQSFDHWPVPEFAPRQDDIDGVAGVGNWHNSSNEFPTDSKTPFYIAKGWGPKYLNSEDGVYKIIMPLQTDTTSAGNLTMGTITMSPLPSGCQPTRAQFTEHTAISMEDGQLVVTVAKETVNLISGDVLFVPANMPFTYHATDAATKFLYVNPGTSGLQTTLLANAVPWNFTVYPQHPPE